MSVPARIGTQMSASGARARETWIDMDDRGACSFAFITQRKTDRVRYGHRGTFDRMQSAFAKVFVARL